MRQLCVRVFVAVIVVAAAAGTSHGQAGPPPAGQAARDCARWPGTVFDEAVSGCLCPQGMWWNMRGDACLPREHAAGEFCAAVWPGSQPLSLAFGYRCICVPPLQWDDDAGACLATAVIGDEECTRQWPGTMAVLSPSGREYECRCPGGKRWDEATRACVAGAPVVAVAPGFFAVTPEPDPAVAPPARTNPLSAPPPDARPAPVPDPVPVPAAPVPPVPARVAPTGNCQAMLAEIRSLAAAGRASQADSLGMKAAVSGCDPAAISEAARVRNPAAR